MTHHVERDLAAFPDDPGASLVLGELLQNGEAVHRRDPAEGLGGLVANHVLLGRRAQDGDECRDRVGGGELSKDVGNLVADDT